MVKGTAADRKLYHGRSFFAHPDTMSRKVKPSSVAERQFPLRSWTKKNKIKKALTANAGLLDANVRDLISKANLAILACGVGN